MAVEVRIPTILRSFTGGEKAVSAEGASLQAVITSLDASYPGIGDRLLDDSGQPASQSHPGAGPADTSKRHRTAEKASYDSRLDARAT